MSIAAKRKARRNCKPIEIDDPLLSIPQSGEYTGLKDSTIRSWVWQRVIPSYRFGRAVRIRKSDLDWIISNGFVPADPKASALVEGTAGIT